MSALAAECEVWRWLSGTVILTAARLTQDNRAITARAKIFGIVLLDRTVLEDGSLVSRLQQLAEPEVPPRASPQAGRFNHDAAPTIRGRQRQSD